MEQTTGNRLSEEQRAQYEELGYCLSVTAFETSEAGFVPPLTLLSSFDRVPCYLPSIR